MTTQPALRLERDAELCGFRVLFGTVTVLTFLAASVPVSAQPAASDESAQGVSHHNGGAAEAAANDGRFSFPGHVAVVSGYGSPIERRNLLGAIAIEQGVSVWRSRHHALVSYAAARVALDDYGLDWNNKLATQLGLKYVRAFSNGVVEAGAGYAHEDRFATEFARGQPIAFANYWFGWGTALASGPRRWAAAFPGSAWGTLGTHAPAEGQNLLLTLHADQGITAVRMGNAALVPFASMTVTADSAGHDWNNARLHGQGLKLLLSARSLLVETAVVYQREYRWRGRAAADRLGAFLTFRYSWKGASRLGRTAVAQPAPPRHRATNEELRARVAARE